MVTMILVIIYMLIAMGFGIFMMKKNTTAAQYFVSKKSSAFFWSCHTFSLR